jgi:hypothetical protein
MSALSDLQREEERLLHELSEVQQGIKKLTGPELGKLPNSRAGFYHTHSDSYECGQAYRDVDAWDASDWTWKPCKKPVNHKGSCGHEDNTAY